MSRLDDDYDDYYSGRDRMFKSCPTPHLVVNNNHHQIDWYQFHSFLLQSMTPKTAEDRLRYAKQFVDVLVAETPKSAQSLVQLTPNKRIHIMKALSSLAKFTGRSNQWREIIQQYQLSWSTGTEKIDAFERFFDDSITLDTMIGWLREALHHPQRQLPAHFANIFLFCTLTGMRASECLAAVRLIKDFETCKRYYDAKNHVLRHYLFADTFIRRTKAIYISIIDDEILEIARKVGRIPTLNTLKNSTRRRHLSMRLKFCRKIHASYLRQNGGIEAEIVDLLEGRVPRSVFARHYLTPTSDYRQKVLAAVAKLKSELEV
jgi:hypothetical protein